MTIDRAIWEAFGMRADDMNALEYELKVAMLSAEAAAQAKRSKKI